MKQYYIYDGNQQTGPFTIDILKNRHINNDTFIWHEGLTDWTKATEIEELIKILPPPIRQTNSINDVNPYLQKPLPDTPINQPKKRILPKIIVYTVLAIILFVGIGAFSSYKNNQERQQFELQMRIAEQERLVREHRIQEIKKELSISYENLEKAKQQLHDVGSFKLLRTSSERHQQLTEAEKIVKSWEDQISILEREMKELSLR